EGALARAARADEGANGAGGNAGGEPVQDGLARLIGEGDARKRDIAAQPADRHGIRRVGDGDGLVKHSLEAVEGGLAALQVVVDRAELFDRLVGDKEREDDREENIPLEVNLV